MSLREFSLMWRDAGLSLAAYGQGAVSMPGQSSKSGGSPTPGDSARPGSGKGGGSSPKKKGGDEHMSDRRRQATLYAQRMRLDLKQRKAKGRDVSCRKTKQRGCRKLVSSDIGQLNFDPAAWQRTGLLRYSAQDSQAMKQGEARSQRVPFCSDVVLPSYNDEQK